MGSRGAQGCVQVGHRDVRGVRGSRGTTRGSRGVRGVSKVSQGVKNGVRGVLGVNDTFAFSNFYVFHSTLLYTRTQ